MESIIIVKNLSKTFQFAVKNPSHGFVRNFLNPERKTITAVDGISFCVQKGESLAFIGPNGAGKSTSIKMLTGILYPTLGEISVRGMNPQKDRQKLSYHIGTVFGQRSQLLFNLPARDSFELFGKIYGMSNAAIAKRQKELVEIFDLHEFVDQSVRKLSLGQRMRCEIAASLIHSPEIIFLDEPTIGLDVVAKQNLRDVLSRLNKEHGTTLFLTSHDPGDIEALCDRTIVINHGAIMFDAPTEDLQKKFFTNKEIRVEFKQKVSNPQIAGAALVECDGRTAHYVVDTKRHSLNNVLKEILIAYEVEDMDVENISLEDIISMMYQKAKEPGV